ncbi:rhodanese-like domain-containing protein [Maridesulfovibrio ferrireducens]|uniref:rhodanese-like domain-containing protein n=1 Tax=Maridesulfovibrio ferrireducens TaxID=246191 RepID=UPI001A2678C7|nr:rhodanese-like domain-containing protein [Maridesulfovibrio ferrireducens]MBI9112625.1 rhodanese-like domain-containing protein [Maridesulfovibrio ferrireducens]
MFAPKKVLSVCSAILMILILASSAFAMKDQYNYMNGDSLQNALDQSAAIAIVDIQVADQFKAHHIKGAIQTCAYPVKSSSDKAKLDAPILDLKTGTQPVVVICPRGQGGAERTVDYLNANGIPSYRLFILTDGQDGWKHAVESK